MNNKKTRIENAVRELALSLFELANNKTTSDYVVSSLLAGSMLRKEIENLTPEHLTDKKEYADCILSNFAKCLY